MTEMDSDNAKISARGDEHFTMAYSEMDTIDQMLRILGYKIITDDGSDEALDIKWIRSRKLVWPPKRQLRFPCYAITVFYCINRQKYSRIYTRFVRFL